MIYDRELLLSPAKSTAVLDLWEVQRYGLDSYGDTDYVSVYGLRPAEWYAKGIRLMGRTAVECTRDVLASAIGRDVAVLAAEVLRRRGVLIVDLFAGSGNTLYWLTRHIPEARGLGFELDADVFGLTRQNLAARGLPLEILNTDYRAGLNEVSVDVDDLLIVFVAPPWGDALDKTSGLDLRLTSPPIFEIVSLLSNTFQNRLLCVVQIYEVLNPESVAELTACFDWSRSNIYRMAASGRNHGVFLGTKHWTPSAA